MYLKQRKRGLLGKERFSKALILHAQNEFFGLFSDKGPLGDDELSTAS
jgi:hypothetical protein